jgi:hypothetical protein
MLLDLITFNTLFKLVEEVVVSQTVVVAEVEVIYLLIQVHQALEGYLSVLLPILFLLEVEVPLCLLLVLVVVEVQVLLVI